MAASAIIPPQLLAPSIVKICVLTSQNHAGVKLRSTWLKGHPNGTVTLPRRQAGALVLTAPRYVATASTTGESETPTTTKKKRTRKRKPKQPKDGKEAAQVDLKDEEDGPVLVSLPSDDEFLINVDKLPAGHRSGYVSLIGRPNAGKSTLLNRLVGQKLSIVTPKPQTTRHRILGIRTDDDSQVIIMDTPGRVFDERTKLEAWMMQAVESAVANSDAVLLIFDVTLDSPEDVAAILPSLAGKIPGLGDASTTARDAPGGGAADGEGAAELAEGLASDPSRDEEGNDAMAASPVLVDGATAAGIGGKEEGGAGVMGQRRAGVDGGNEDREEEEEEGEAEGEASSSVPDVMIVLNKVDLLDEPQLQQLLEAFTTAGVTLPITPISALHGDGVGGLVEWIKQRMPVGPAFYPRDIVSEHPERFFIAEIFREHIYNMFYEEIPYCSQVNVVDYKARSPKHFVQVVIYVEKESQKKIIIGKGGSAIKELSSAARKDIEDFVQSPVYLEVQVEVAKNWREDEALLKKFGYRGSPRF
eukprot:jgi/Mesvir1/27259/Mv07096-RA.1